MTNADTNSLLYVVDQERLKARHPCLFQCGHKLRIQLQALVHVLYVPGHAGSPTPQFHELS